MRLIVLVAVVLVAGCIGGVGGIGGERAPVGYTELKNIVTSGQADSPLLTDVMHLTAPRVENGNIEIDVQVGSLDSNQVSTPDCVDCYELKIRPLRGHSLNDAELGFFVVEPATRDTPGKRTSLAQHEDWEVVQGQTIWTGDVPEGQTYTDTLVVKPKNTGVWQIESILRVRWEDIGHNGSGQVSDRYGDVKLFYALYDGRDVLLSKDGVWCRDNTYFDEKELVCKAPPDCPEGYIYNKGDNTCAPLAVRVGGETTVPQNQTLGSTETPPGEIPTPS